MSRPARMRRILAGDLTNGVVITALIVSPLFLQPYQVMRFTQILVIAVAVMGLNLLTRFTGQVSVGHSAFFGVGAYTTGVLAESLSGGLAFAAGLLAGAVTGLLVGLPSLRIKGTPLAIVTLVLAAAFPAIVNILTPTTGGLQGMRVPLLTLPNGLLAPDQTRYAAVLLVLLLVGAATAMLRRSRAGLALRALGDHETAAIVYGIRAPRLRLGIFALSAAVTAGAGSLFALTSGFLSSSTSFLTIAGSVTFLAAMVIGGRAILIGPLIGAAIVELVPAQIAISHPEWAGFVYGAMLILIVFTLPTGLTSLPDAVLHSWQHHHGRKSPTRVAPTQSPSKGTLA